MHRKAWCSCAHEQHRFVLLSTQMPLESIYFVSTSQSLKASGESRTDMMLRSKRPCLEELRLLWVCRLLLWVLRRMVWPASSISHACNWRTLNWPWSKKSLTYLDQLAKHNAKGKNIVSNTGLWLLCLPLFDVRNIRRRSQYPILVQIVWRIFGIRCFRHFL